MAAQETKYVPLARNALDKTPLKIEELRPSLKHLNWQLRRLGLSLQVKVDTESDAHVMTYASTEQLYGTKQLFVLGVNMVEDNPWYVECNSCKKEYRAGFAAIPECPFCGSLEDGDSL